MVGYPILDASISVRAFFVLHYAELGLYRNGDDIPGDLLKLEGHTGSGRLYCHMYGEGHYPVDVEQSFVWSA